MLYLTLYGTDASEQSGGGVDYFRISHKETIINWLEKCVAIAARFPMVRETIIQYINHLKQLTNQGMETVHRKELLSILTNSEDNLYAFFELVNFKFSLNDVKEYLITEVLLPQLEKIYKELHFEFEYKGAYLTPDCPVFFIKIPDCNFLIFSEFQYYELGEFCIGVLLKDMKNSNYKIWEKLKAIFESHESQKNQVWVPDNGMTYKNWKNPEWGPLDVMKAIISGEMAKIFENEINDILKIIVDVDLDLDLYLEM